MKRLLPVFTVCILTFFLLNSGGVYILLVSVRAGEKMQLWRQIEEGLCNDMAMQVQVSAIDVKNETNGFEWEEDGREFRLNGSMYDVIRFTTQGDMAVFTCVNDTREEEMNGMVDDYIAHHFSRDETKKNHTNTLLELIPKHYLPAAFKFFNSSEQITYLSQDTYSTSTLAGHSERRSPPPKCLFST